MTSCAFTLDKVTDADFSDASPKYPFDGHPSSVCYNFTHRRYDQLDRGAAHVSFTVSGHIYNSLQSSNLVEGDGPMLSTRGVTDKRIQF
jgi:hypothetical protein